ncbi:hypothetical protein H072_5162 [Dactylellina haptotyla CBS 200.50]|uniref:Extracellular membrane protein CFEM domain-containing protein n=1 Tax=Dactylellina haptotyla (strain CBS 200.50) TaxID=1284197 RepID=S8C091_DACHA|nr:hypothetical protein H072_5162 [Dactylellina haptotyla CBS 200.50]
MKFSTLTTVAGLTAMVAAIPQASITAAPSGAAAGYDAAYSSTLSCINSCGPGNVYCQAECQGLPTPDGAALNATHDCVAACPPGGSAEANAAWAKCQQACVASFYWSASGTYSSYVVPTPAGFTNNQVPAQATDAAAASGTSAISQAVSGATSSGSKASKTSGAPSSSSTTKPTESPNAGAVVSAPMLSVFGLVLAAFAL